MSGTSGLVTGVAAAGGSSQGWTGAQMQGARVVDFSSILATGLTVTNLPAFSYFNVKDPRYAGGAKGDGVTDDSAAMQAAINAAVAAGGGIVYFPAGTYIQNNTAAVAPPDTLAGRGVSVLGAGRDVSFIKAGAAFSGTLNAVFNLRGNCFMQDITIDGGGVAANVGSFGSNLGTGMQDIVFRTTRFQNGGSGNGWLFSVIGTASIQDVVIIDMELIGPSSTVQDAIAIGNGNVVNVDITNMYINGVYRSPNLFIANNAHIDGLYLYNITGSTASFVIDAGVIACQATNIYVDSSCTLPFAINAKNVVLSNSQILGGIVTLGLTATTLAMTSFKMSNCTLATLQLYGVSTNNPDVVLSGNKFQPAGGNYAIQESRAAASSWSNWTIVGNTFINTGAAWMKSVNSNQPTLFLVEANQVSGSSAFSGMGPSGTAVFRNNLGFNPRGNVTIAAPVLGGNAYATAVTNNTGSDVTVVLATGAGVTISVVNIGGVATGITLAASSNTSYRLPAGQTTQLAGAGGSASWVWFAD